jgi:autophagy-related protein 9
MSNYSKLKQENDDIELATTTNVPKQGVTPEDQVVDNRIEFEDETPASPSTTPLSQRKSDHGIFLNNNNRRAHIAISNLDDFFSKVYKYFYEKGFWNILLQRLIKLITVLFVIVFSAAMFIFLNWAELWACSQQECKDVSVLRIPQELSNFHMVVLVFEGAFSCYWFVTFVQYVYEIGGLLKIKHFFNNDLGISESDIQTILWSELVDKIVKVQETIPISRVKAKLDERDIVNLIMRKENYLIAFLNKKVVDLRLPFFGSKPILTETLLWNLRYIISSMFDENFYIKESIVSSPNEYVKLYYSTHSLVCDGSLSILE